VAFTRRSYLISLGVNFAAKVFPVPNQLLSHWRRIASLTDGLVGAAAFHLPSGQYTALNGQIRFPLASVCKLPIAMRILSLVDVGELSLTEEVEVLPRDVFPSWNGDIASHWHPHQ
jgi:beta-lactamase class A